MPVMPHMWSPFKPALVLVLKNPWDTPRSIPTMEKIRRSAMYMAVRIRDPMIISLRP